MNVYLKTEFTPSHTGEKETVIIKDYKGEFLTIGQLQVASCLKHISYEQLSVSEPYYYGVEVKSLLDLANHVRKVLLNEGIELDLEGE